MEKEEISSRPRMFHSIFDKINNCSTLKSCKAAKTEISLIMFYSDMSDKSIEFESEAKDVMVVTAVSDHEAPIRFTRKYLLRGLA